MTAQRGEPAQVEAPTAVCTCGPGAWGTCDTCGVNAWIKHHCPFPCDDVTCEDGSACIGCLTGRSCPVHNDTEEDW